MKAYGFMKVLRHINFSTAILILTVAFVFTANASTPPLKIRMADAPQFLTVGKAHVFTLEVQNTSDKPFTFSLLPGFNSDIFWHTKSGAGGGAMGGNYSSTCTSSTSLNPETGELVCKTLCYQPKDFITLQPKESRRIKVTVNTPEEIQARRATATINFQLDSNFDGKDLELSAWTGTLKFQYKLPIIREARGK
jgi:hypothetical protein